MMFYRPVVATFLSLLLTTMTIIAGDGDSCHADEVIAMHGVSCGKTCQKDPPSPPDRLHPSGPACHVFRWNLASHGAPATGLSLTRLRGNAGLGGSHEHHSKSTALSRSSGATQKRDCHNVMSSSYVSNHGQRFWSERVDAYQGEGSGEKQSKIRNCRGSMARNEKSE